MIQPKKSMAASILAPGIPFYVIGDEGFDSTIAWQVDPPPDITDDAINTQLQLLWDDYPLALCAEQAKQRLQRTDWSELSSVSDASIDPHLLNKNEYDDYRLAIRRLMISPVVNPSWPTEPTPQWSSF